MAAAVSLPASLIDNNLTVDSYCKTFQMEFLGRLKNPHDGMWKIVTVFEKNVDIV